MRRRRRFKVQIRTVVPKLSPGQSARLREDFSLRLGADEGATEVSLYFMTLETDLKGRMRTNSIGRWVLAAGSWLSLASLFAQEPLTAPSVTFAEDKLWLLTGPTRIATTNQVVFPGDIKINTNGVFTVQNGKERPLKPGQVLAPDGMLTSPGGSVVPVQDHLAAQGGRVHLVKDGEATPLTSPHDFPDGSRVQPGGEIVLPTGRMRRMLDGQITRLDGVSFPVTDTASWQDGKVVLFKDGGKIELRPTEKMMMSDGTRIGGDGTITRADGSTAVLAPGELLKLSGVVSPKKD